jgi:hypothetical protein
MSRDIGTERTRPDFGVVSAPPAKLARTRIADAAKSTSLQRDELTAPQPGVRGRQVDRGVLLGVSRAREGVHLLDAEHLDIAARVLRARSLRPG